MGMITALIFYTLCLSVSFQLHAAEAVTLEKIGLTDGRTLEGQLVDQGDTYKILIYFKGRQMGSIEVDRYQVKYHTPLKSPTTTTTATTEKTTRGRGKKSSRSELSSAQKRVSYLEKELKEKQLEVIDLPNRKAELELKINRLLGIHNREVDEYNAMQRSYSNSKAKRELRNIEKKYKSYSRAKKEYETFIGKDIPELRREVLAMTEELQKLQGDMASNEGDVASAVFAGSKKERAVKVVKRGETTQGNLNPTESSVLILVDNSGSGSGFVVNKLGYVITNAHVVLGENGQRAKKLKIMYDLGAGRSSEDYKIVQVNSEVDLALLAPIKAGKKYQPMLLRTDPMLGERIRVFGFPMAMQTKQSTQSAVNNIVLSSGNIASLRRNAKGQLTALQIDVRVSPGNSGGPVVDDSGAVLGVVQYAVRNDLVTDAQNFAIPTAKILSTFKQALAED
ncbi:MAG: trypsin-like peptidase domain-containing protein [Planctomycetes bacterium]|nr:trypsin-like peptidase domain-containing protein [Planctomycetota bacterium]